MRLLLRYNNPNAALGPPLCAGLSLPLSWLQFIILVAFNNNAPPLLIKILVFLRLCRILRLCRFVKVTGRCLQFLGKSGCCAVLLKSIAYL